MSQSTRQSRHSPETQTHPSHSQMASSSGGLSTTAAANHADIIEQFKDKVRKQECGEEVTDEYFVLVVAANWGMFNEAYRTGKLSKANLEQMWRFVNEKTRGTNWVDCALNRAEHFLSACKAHDRIDRLLFYLHFAKPERYPEANMLFSIIRYLRERPNPSLLGDKDVASQLQADANWGSPSLLRNWPVEVKHAVLLTAKGEPLSREDAMRCLLHAVKGMCFAAGKGWLHEQNKQRLREINAGLRELVAGISAWQEQRKLLVDKATREAKRIPTGVFEGQPPPMAISEAYHFASVLHQAYAQQPGREFDEPRRILQDLRRELHRDLTDAQTKTDFSKLSSNNK